MQEDDLHVIQKKWHGSFTGYIIGFTLSVLLTAASFALAATLFLKGYTLIFTLIGLAVVQAAAQLLFFLHIGQEAKPRWETFVFVCMASVLLIIALGSLWVMYDLNNRMMPGMTPII